MTTYGQVRIGDAERDSAAEALSEHYASGRITKPEYDERLEAIWAAKFDADLRPVFADLPGSPGAQRASQPVSQPWSAPRQAARRGGPPWPDVARGARLFWLAPVMLVGLAAFVFVALQFAPWLLFVGFWIFMCGGFGRARHGFGHRRHQHHHA